MTDSRYGHINCAVQHCNNTPIVKSKDVLFYNFPTMSSMRSKWLEILKSRCTTIDWARSRICSRHFEHKYIDSQKKLKDNAIPTIFPSPMGTKVLKTVKPADNPTPRTKVDRLLNKVAQTELMADVKNTLSLIKVPDSYLDFVHDNLTCDSNTPVEAQLWLLIRKQDHLITRLQQQVMQNKKHLEVLQKNMEESRAEKREMEQNMENYKYIAKCLQEKQATLEEQIEILTAVESR